MAAAIACPRAMCSVGNRRLVADRSKSSITSPKSLNYIFAPALPPRGPRREVDMSHRRRHFREDASGHLQLALRNHGRVGQVATIRPALSKEVRALGSDPMIHN